MFRETLNNIYDISGLLGSPQKENGFKLFKTTIQTVVRFEMVAGGIDRPDYQNCLSALFVDVTCHLMSPTCHPLAPTVTPANSDHRQLHRLQQEPSGNTAGSTFQTQFAPSCSGRGLGPEDDDWAF